MNKKIIDHHMHTNFSPDADPKATMELYIQAAREKGIEGIMFTDHVDFDYPTPIFDDMIDYDLYQKEIERVRAKENFKVFMGVEMGYQPHLNQMMSDFLKSYPFDFVICSIHVGDRLDFYNGDFFKGKTQKEAYMRYYEIVLNAVRSYDDYDVFGHLDYIIRYGGFENRSYLLKDYADILDQILTTIIKKGKGIEINTSGIRYGLGVLHPGIDLLKRYKELGGKIVTFGSDAHKVYDYYDGFEEAKKMLIEAGFEYITVFQKRIPEFVKI
ncbi:MAG: histidinol-phosphatase HisJ family protein [Acholeplasmataceae bacterium]|nr:histidinol-phosphatase HisJ family protein [Acholeplasmataceae bacterium]